MIGTLPNVRPRSHLNNSWNEEGRREREKVKNKQKRKGRIVTTILSLLNTPTCLTRGWPRDEIRENLWITRETSMRKRREEAKTTGIVLEYLPTRDLPFSWTGVANLFRRFSREESVLYGWNSALGRRQHPSYPAATNYRLRAWWCIVAGTRGVRGGISSDEHCGPIVPIRLRQSGRSDAILI